MNISQMLGSDLAGVLTALALVITSVASLLSVLLSFLNRRNIEVVRHATNSLKDELVASTKAASLAEGHATGFREGRELQRRTENEAKQKRRFTRS